MIRRGWRTAVVCVVLGMLAAPAGADEVGAAARFFATDRLAAWCIVPFDDQPRTPAERVALLGRLGLGRYAYDYRAKHVAQFDEEMGAVRGAGIELVGWWFPGGLNDEARTILGVLERQGIRTSLWVTGGGGPTAGAEEQAARARAEAERLRPIATAAARIGCRVGLYNHGGWFGEPENQIEIIRALAADGIDNVGIVYNQHHGHSHLPRWKESLAQMLPHLHFLNLNGMTADGESTGRKILVIGQGDLDVALAKTICESGYTGPIGILNHTGHDAEARLLDNLEGLDWVVGELAAKPIPKPTPRTN